VARKPEKSAETIVGGPPLKGRTEKTRNGILVPDERSRARKED
jgi:hypothetical protein